MKKTIATTVVTHLSKCRNLRLCLAFVLLSCSAANAKAVEISLDARASYLRTDAEDFGATAAVPIDLASLGISAGDTIRLELLGDYDFTIHDLIGDTSTTVGGVFSSSATLLGPGEANRVAGAIEAGSDHPTFVTLFDLSATDISEDFLVSDLVIQVPLGATHLFVAPTDSYYGDNQDGNNDLAIRITAVPEVASTAGLLMIGLGSLFWGARRGRVLRS